LFSQLHHHVLLGSVDFLLADLGVSSPQLDRAERGFSFTRDGPLDMRMEPEGRDATAAELVNSTSHERLVHLFRTLGEERFAPRIAAAILAERARSPIATTGRLAKVVAAAVPARFHRKGHHPATKVFQALRMAVNDELGELERLLERTVDLLRPGGRVAVISFHSLEDRLVKTAFRKWEQPCECPPELPLCVCGKTPLGARATRRPIVADPMEARANPRSRSAKLRAFEKS
ncbi:MAG: 16S rRNA (cytosine(1402)-N(4))-methyltransferase RsmH, partial [SAR324 cluster bacterium]|nr:16S rRNA (cytosine(1402)-N(4))-methyltransferase RsmH [SAR324 cluster bacterium]